MTKICVCVTAHKVFFIVFTTKFYKVRVCNKCKGGGHIHKHTQGS